MRLETLKVLCAIRGLSQSELARLAGVSRQAVSLWFKSKKKELAIQSTHLQKLAVGLGVSADLLISPLPFFESEAEKKRMAGSLIWDRLFPTLEAFLLALLSRDPRALARLVQVYGFFQAEKISGKIVWNKFEEYKKHMIPVRRQQCERLWKQQKELDLI